MKAIASVRLTGTSALPSFSVATHVASRVLRIFWATRSTASSQLISSMIASRSAVTGRLKPVRRAVRGKHGYAFHAQRSPVHDVVVVAFHRNQLPFAHRRDHTAATRAKIARGGKFIDFREF